MRIKVATDFSDTPGARYYNDGEFSGQQFYEKVLRPAFRACIEKGEMLEVDCDDCYGFPSSFISESFGKLSTEFGRDTVLRGMVIVTQHDPLLPEQIKSVIVNPGKKAT